MSFSDLGLSPKVLAAVEASGYTAPTPIQEQAIPHVLGRRDVLGIAQTGTGKTASFVLPMLTMLEKGRARARMPRTLILEPTRELAAQVEDHFNRYGQNHKLTVALLIGGVSFGDQDKKVDRGADVLIATPGRLLDHFERGKLLMSAVKILVIDEADRMLDMGFIPDIERIIKLLPMTRQTLFFSATMPPEIQRLADRFLSNPVRVEVSRPASTVKTVTQNFVKVGREPSEKRASLRELIRGAGDLKNAIIFCNRKRDVATLARSLQRHGFNAGALHGDMDQHARTAMLESFRKGQLMLLVASDVAARGLDIPDVSHIFNFDVPTHAEDYVHRIGRTGRAGRSGTAITLVAPIDSKYVSAIERLTGDTLSWTGKSWSDKPAEESRPPRGEKSSRRGRGRHDRREKAPAPAQAAPGTDQSAPHVEAKAEPRQLQTAPPAPEFRPEPPRQQQTAPQAPESRPEPQRQPPTAPLPAAPQASKDGRHRPDRQQEERKGEKVVGLGDHVPQFLLRPVRLTSS